MKYKFPYGKANFKTIRTENYFFIDRSSYISLLEDTAGSILFVRPRRFGKSLFANMLYAYYDINEEANFENYFNGLYIGDSRNHTPFKNKFMVIKYDFSEVSVDGILDQIIINFNNYCNDCIKDFKSNYKNLLQEEIEINKDDPLSSFGNLIRQVKQINQKLYVIVDEYDNFLNEIMVRGRKDDYSKLATGDGVLKSFFKKLKAKESSVIERIFITGVSPVVLNDVSSGFNIATDISLFQEFNDLVGFKEEEIFKTIDTIIKNENIKYDVDYVVTKIANYYNGYKFNLKSTEKIYNPTLSLYFFNEFQKNHEFPSEMLDKNLQIDINKLHFIGNLDNGKQIIFDILNNEEKIEASKVTTEFKLNDLLTLGEQNRDYIISLMYYWGLLTLKEKAFQQEFQIPNYVSKRLYFEKLQTLLSPKPLNLTEIQKKFFLDTNVEAVCEFMEKSMLSCLSNRDYLLANELSYKLIFLTCFYKDDTYYIDSEKEVLRGYCDLLFTLREGMEKTNGKNILIEFKFITLNELNLTGLELREKSRESLYNIQKVKSLLEEATTQAKFYGEVLEKKYSSLNLKKLVFVGLGFDRMVGKVV